MSRGAWFDLPFIFILFNLHVCKNKSFLGSFSHRHGLALAAVRLDWFGLVCVRGGRDEQSRGLSFPMERRA
jgi:hypothetical protein